MRTKTRKPLDPFSTSQKKVLNMHLKPQRCASGIPLKCSYNAPYFAYLMVGKTWGVVQGNCHHWDCPRCGLGRAKHEYGRIIEGCKSIAENHVIWFITITCKGKGLSHEEAEANYLKWTNRFLSACRARCKNLEQTWTYVQVTERQRRGHPHSHILTTFNPGDCTIGRVTKWKTDNSGRREPIEVRAIRSQWLAGQVIRSGLGDQYDISYVRTHEGASRYVAKYLFKETIFENTWPKHWKRVRYSQTFPKLESALTEAKVMLSRDDWMWLSRQAVRVICENTDTEEYVTWALYHSDVLVTTK